MADSVAYSAYSRWLSKGELSEYCRGQVAGLESLFQNFNNYYEDVKDYASFVKTEMNKEDADDKATE